MAERTLLGDAHQDVHERFTGSTGRTNAVVVQSYPLAYWASRNADPEPRYVRANQVWATDPDTGKTVNEWGNVDLKRGTKDADLPFQWVTALQTDLWNLGYKAVFAHTTTGVIPAEPNPSGTFDRRTEWCVRRFQIHASLTARKVEGRPLSVAKTYEGEVTGVMDDATKREMKIWLENNYTRKLQPFDPEGILTAQVAAGLFCPTFFDLLAVTLYERCDAEDIELYGAMSGGYDPDGHRATHPYNTWHLAGLGCDLNFYSTLTPAISWGTVRRGYAEYDSWPRHERTRYYTTVHAVGLATARPVSKDPRHVEYHPLLPSPNGATVWTSPPRAVRNIVSKTGGNTAAEIRSVWAIAVDAKYGTAPVTSIRPRPRPEGLGE